MKCNVCEKDSRPVFTAKVLRKYDVQYFQCPHCEFVQTEEPHWLAEAYQSSITIADTGILVRNQQYAKLTAVLLYALYGKDVRCLDFAGGYGIFTRMMRDIGFEFLWSDKYTPNLLARGFEYRPGAGIDVVTAFESFEHLPNPKNDIAELLKISKNLIFSTLLLPRPLPSPEQWWYYVLDHGQHVSFFSKKSMTVIAQQFGLNLASNGVDFHMLTQDPVSPLLFRVLTTLPGKALYSVVSRAMKSKTQDDMKFALKSGLDVDAGQ
jgi:hypothetical protein